MDYNKNLKYLIDRFELDLKKESPFFVNCSRYVEFLDILKELGVKTGVEVGVLEGAYTKFLCESNKDMHIYAVDPWLYYETTRRRNRSNNEQYEAIYQNAVKNLGQYENCTIIRKASMDAVNDFKDNSLDFVYIDANHEFQYVVNDIAEWSKKVKMGGIISGHDFGDSPLKLHCMVETVVRGWTKSRGIHPLIVMRTTNKQRRELGVHDKPSWMWLKQTNKY